jgi:hypothetical protein
MSCEPKKQGEASRDVCPNCGAQLMVKWNPQSRAENARCCPACQHVEEKIKR